MTSQFDGHDMEQINKLLIAMGERVAAISEIMSFEWDDEGHNGIAKRIKQMRDAGYVWTFDAYKGGAHFNLDDAKVLMALCPVCETFDTENGWPACMSCTTYNERRYFRDGRSAVVGPYLTSPKARHTRPAPRSPAASGTAG